MEDHGPVLVSSKPLKQDFEKFEKIVINSENFTLGRGLHNSVTIPHVFLSRDHCRLKKQDEGWMIEDCSSFGIEVNGKKLGKGQKQKLCNGDVIKLESTNEFVYTFHTEKCEYYIPCKRRKLDSTSDDEDIINNVKKKFEESQSYEIQHIEDKIQNAKHMQTTTKILKEQLQLDLSRKEKQLQCDYAAQIEKLKGKKNEVEQQKALLIEERDAQLAAIKVEMEGKIAALMEQIAKHNENESELMQENNSLKEKLQKEREEFLSELSRESSSKQEMLDRLQAKIREQEEGLLKEKKEMEETLRRETEQLRLANEKELKELAEQKKKREMELEEELRNIKTNLAKQIEIHENEKREAEQLLNEQKEQLKKVNDEERATINQLIEERGEIEKKLALAHTNAESSIHALQEHVEKRETELAALAADRIQQQAEQSSEVISSLQAQLEKVRGQLQSVETEKNTLLESLCSGLGEGSSKQTTVADVEELMESELTCSICSEMFIKATTLNCSHTFCKYCIDKWKKNKKECPICRTPIISECKSIVLDSLIERVTQSSEETKQKRQDILKCREAEVVMMTTPRAPAATRRGRGRGRGRNTITMTTPTAATVNLTNTTANSAASTIQTRSTGTAAQSRPIPVVDLTTTPVMPREPPLVVPVELAPAGLRLMAPRGAPPPVYHVVRMPNGNLVRLGGAGAGESPVSLAHITAATDAASAAARAAIGRLAAHYQIGNQRQPAPSQATIVRQPAPSQGTNVRQPASVRQLAPSQGTNVRQPAPSQGNIVQYRGPAQGGNVRQPTPLQGGNVRQPTPSQGGNLC